MTNLPPHLAKILGRNPAGFIQRFEELLPEHKYNYEAYEAVEEEYSGITGERRYDSWSSFRVVRERLINRRHKLPKSPDMQNFNDKAA